MIQLEELRIGNLIIRDGIDYDANGNKFHDSEGDEVIVVTPGIIANIYDWSKNTGGMSSGYSPIPLTEEWLPKLGFVTMSGAESLHRISILISSNYSNGKISQIQEEEKPDKIDVYVNFFDGFDYYVGDIDFPLRHIKFVHQIQNLYFDLKGSPLPFNSIFPSAPASS